MRENPHGVTGVEIVALHNFHPVSFHPLQKNKLVYTHFTCNPCKKGERQFYHRMKPYKTSDAWIHFFYWQRCMSATKSMYPSSTLNCIGHHFCGFMNVVHLCFFNFAHYISDVREPLHC